MITVRNLEKTFPAVKALDKISIQVKRGEIYGFIGRNGAGKSTTMNILTGLSRPTGGEAVVNGKNVSNTRHPGELQLGYLPEDPRFFPWLSAYETLEYLGNTGKRSIKKEEAEKLLEWGGLKEAAGRRTGGFSRGMKQRLGICCAMIGDPELLILDEPSSALDPQGRSDVLNLILDLKTKGKTILFSSHILSDVERVCDTIGLIDGGKILFEKPLAMIYKEYIHPIFDMELNLQDPSKLVPDLEEMEEIIKVEVQGNFLSIHITNPDAASPKIMRFMGEKGVPVISFLLRKSTLEDIFIRGVNAS